METGGPPTWLDVAPPPSSPDEYGAISDVHKSPGPTSSRNLTHPTSASCDLEFATGRKNEGRSPIILDRRDPLPSARALLEARYMDRGQRALHHYRGTFYLWNKNCYQQIDRDAIEAEIWGFLEWAFHKTDTGVKPFQPNRARVADIYSALAAVCNLPGHVEAPTWLAEDTALPPADQFLPVKNGLLHLPTGEIYPASPNYFGLNAAGTAYDPDAPEPTEWLRFLQQLWPNDPQSIGALQDIFGLLLSPDTSQQKLFLIVGPKRSGKGTLARVLTSLLGKHSVAGPTLASLATNFGLAPLIGKSLAIVGDARLGAQSNQAVITERLLSISGEDAVTVDRKYLQAWTGRLTARFMIMTNELPRLADASGALASRFIVLTMERSFFGSEDVGLGSRLEIELPGILNWALAGYRRYRERGHLIQPDCAREAITELEALGSPITAFLKERCVVGASLHCSPDRLYREWAEWCGANGRKETGTKQVFGSMLRSAVPGLKIIQRRLDGDRAREYQGISVK